MERKGRGAEIRYALADSPLGRMLVARTEAGVCAVAFADADGPLLAELRGRYPEAAIRSAEDLAGDLEQILRCLNPEPATLDLAPDLALDVAGTAFEQRVWAAMRNIPRGATREYGEFATSLGIPRAARAVGAAIGKNPVAVLNPCHRVVARGGRLHRYYWGIERKQWLLALEQKQAGMNATVILPGQGELPLGI